MTDSSESWEPKPIGEATHLYDVAHCRSGDKGDTCNIVVVPFDDDSYDELVNRLTTERVAAHFGDLVTGSVKRYPVPNVACINFVLAGALDGGSNRSLRLDPHGKTLGR